MASQPNSTPFIPGPYRSVNAIFATANTDQSGVTGTTALVYTSPATGNGTYVKEMDIAVPGTSTAAVVVVLIFDGTTLVAIKFVPVSAITPSATVPPFSVRAAIDAWIPASGTIRVLTTVAQSTHARTTLADY